MLELTSGTRASLRSQATIAAETAIASGVATLAIALDALPYFGADAAAATIVALRKMRGAGGSVRLVTKRDEVRRELHRMGLDKVFDVSARADGAGDAYRNAPAGSRSTRVAPHEHSAPPAAAASEALAEFVS